MNSHTLFANTPPVKLFFMASIPGAIGMLAGAIYTLVDGIFVGQFLGETAFAAINLAMPFVIINFALADLIGVGSSVPIAISLGQKEEARANNIFTCSCLMIVGTGIIIGALLYAIAPALIELIGAEGEFARLAVEYLRVYAACSPLTTIIFAVDNYLRICGKIRSSMGLNILMAVSGASMELLFLSVFHWGVWSAALAFCLAMILCVVIAFIPFFRGKMLLRFCRPRFSVGMIKQILACGTPTFLNNVAGRITSIVFNAILVRLGGEAAVSIYGILMYVEGFIQPLLYGMCDSLQPAIGYNWGARQYSRVRAIGKCCFTASAVIALIFVAVILIFPAQISELFVPGGSSEFLATSVLALQLFSFTYVTRWFSFASQSFMLAIEKTIPASLISISTVLVFPLLLILIFWPLGLTGIWLNFAGTSLLAFGLSLAMLLKYRRELRQPDEPRPQPPSTEKVSSAS